MLGRVAWGIGGPTPLPSLGITSFSESAMLFVLSTCLLACAHLDGGNTAATKLRVALGPKASLILWPTVPL